VTLWSEYADPDTGHDLLMWTTSHYDFEAQMIRIVVWTDEVDELGVLLRRQYRRLSFSWLEPDQARALLAETGFKVEALYGDFDRRPFDETSPNHIWVARRTDSA
jgi:hypothetical protein